MATLTCQCAPACAYCPAASEDAVYDAAYDDLHEPIPTSHRPLPVACYLLNQACAFNADIRMHGCSP